MFLKTEAITHRFWMWGLGNWLYNTSDASCETSVETKLISARTRVLVKVKFRRGLHTVFVILSHGYFTHIIHEICHEKDMWKTSKKHVKGVLPLTLCFRMFLTSSWSLRVRRTRALAVILIFSNRLLSYYATSIEQENTRRTRRGNSAILF